jgi:8-oxo-dGTP pyrophosphatase MutT (NUDIX family)
VSNPGRTTTLERVLVGRNEYVEVFLNRIRREDRTEGTHLRVSEPRNGAVALVVDDQERVLLLRLYRYGVDGERWEIPRGYGRSGETGKDTAAREAEEESGVVTVSPPLLLGYVEPNSSILESRIPVFLVVMSAMRVPTDPNESPAAVSWFNWEELMSLAKRGQLVDGFTLSALLLWMAHRTAGRAGADDTTRAEK